MPTQQYLSCRAVARTTYLPAIAVGALATALALANWASAAIIVDALSYDGHVSNGTTTGVEAHNTMTDFPPPIATIPLPKTGNPPSPLLNAKDLQLQYTTASEQFPVPGGPLYSTGIITISAASGRIFTNNLDPLLTYPVEFDAFLYSNTPGKKIVISPGNIGLENGFNVQPFSPPDSSTVSGTGTQADPLHLHLNIKSSQVSTATSGDYGFLKVHLRYTEADAPVVPEPSTFALLFAGIAGLLGPVIRGMRR